MFSRLFLVLAGVSACSSSGTADAPVTPPTSSATYEVPVPATLAAAATFEVEDVKWSIDGGTARLAYNLPRGLVGRSLRVDFSGAFDAATNTGTLVGDAGTAECTLVGSALRCNETMRGLLPIDADLSTVEAIAKTEYAGPVQDRLDVAKVFGGDPLGVLRADVSTSSAVDDEGRHQNGKDH